MIFVSLFLAMLTSAVYFRTAGFDFVSYDDPYYVSDNPHVQAGLTTQGLVWAFTTSFASNWHPLTWLSLMLDCQLFGVKAGGHHLINVFFHIINTLLLFWVLHRMTGALWRSGFVAAAFALHPLHVESVAWIAERKDVLSGMFWLLTMAVYLYYVKKPSVTRYLPVAILFALGLMAKPMLVTLPFVLLLLDWWPLGRFKLGGEIKSDKEPVPGPESVQVQPHPAGRLIGEKIPLFFLSGLSAAVTLLVEAKSAGSSLEAISLNIRLANAVVSYVKYMGKMFWPSGLAVLYPHPRGYLPVGQVLSAAILLLAISIGVILLARRRGYLMVGWFWYLGTLVPVIGLVQVGVQAMVDRYTYIPSMGIFIMVAWGVVEVLGRWRYRVIFLSAASGLTIAVLTAGTYKQLDYWKNSDLLYHHALTVTKNNYVMHGNYASSLLLQGRYEDAINHCRIALEIYPPYADAHNNWGIALKAQGQLDEAIIHFQRAVQIDPRRTEFRYNLANALAIQGQRDEAISQYYQLLQLKHNEGILDWAKVYNNLANTLAFQGRWEEAIRCYREALRIRPGYSLARENLSKALRFKENMPSDKVDN